MSHPSSPSWKLLTALLMLSLVPVLAGMVRLWGLAGGDAITPANARFMAAPVPVILHIVSATMFCVLGAGQFDPALRRRYPRLHRGLGRVLVPCGLCAALTGAWMTAIYAIPADQQGPLLVGARMAVGLGMTLALAVSLRAVLQRRIAAHRAWMIRAYALGQGAGTQALILMSATVAVGAPSFFFRDVLMASAWGLNVILAEWIIRRRPSL